MQRISSQALGRAGLVALSVVLIVFFVHFLWSFRYLPGTDAYYYALETQSLLETGHLKVPDHGSVYYVVAALARFGLPIETAFRVSLTVIFLLYQAAMLLFILRVEQKIQAIAALFWVLSVPLIAFHTIEFPNLTLGLSTIPIWFSFVIRSTRRSQFCLAALLLSAALAHPLAAALAMVFAGIVVGSALAETGLGKRALFVTASAVTLIVSAAFIYSRIASRLPSLLHLGPPALVSLVKTPDVPNELKFTVLAFWLLLALLLITGWRSWSPTWRGLGVFGLALPLFPDSLGLAGLGERLAAAFIFLALPLTIGLCHQLRRDTAVDRLPRVLLLDAAWAKRLVVTAAVIAVSFSTVRIEAYRSLLMVDDYDTYEKIVAALKDGKIRMLIAHRGLDFFYSYRLRQDAFHFDPEPEWNRAEIWRVAARVTPEEIAYYSTPACPWGKTAKLIGDTDYILVREDCWEQFRARLKRSDNPDLYAEVWENMENPSQPRPTFLRARHRDLVTDSLSQPGPPTKSQ